MPLPVSQPRFRLTRFFAVASLIGILIVTACLLYTYRVIAESTLIAHEGRANADLTRAVANSIWQRYPDFLTEHPPERTGAELLADPRSAEIRELVLGKMEGLSVVKVKFYDRKGLTLFSTDPKQTGERKVGNPGLIGALAGQPMSQLGFRDRFDAFEGEIKGRNIISTYVPVRTTRDGAIEGVVEIYSDVTPLLVDEARARWIVAASFFGLLSLLYFFLAAVIRKADRIIEGQEAERAEREKQAVHQAHHDALTGLPNRALFSLHLDQAIVNARQAGSSLALMFIDLDRFKAVNDSRGHLVGDALLAEVASRLRAHLGDQVPLFRMGGDEFTAVLPDISGPIQATAMAERLISAVDTPFNCLGHDLAIGASVGIALYPHDGDSADILLRNADAAMYSAKATARGSLAVYHSDLNQRAGERLDLEAALRRAFHQNEFVVYYQPRLDAVTRRVVALEALLRWARPGHGLVAPADFIPILEDCGMMPAVGEWVLRKACAQLQRWHAAGWTGCRVSVNVSGSQFRHDDLVQTVARVLLDTDVAPAQVELELTESLLITDIDHARATVQALQGLGVRVSVDDFGIGYSSLNYLRQFPVDFVKMDRSFISDIETNERDRAMASAILDLARTMDIGVVAEGVESEAQADFFTASACEELQGFLFCRPLPPDDLAGFLAAQARPGPVQATPLPAPPALAATD